jgi:hypothetical protein
VAPEFAGCHDPALVVQAGGANRSRSKRASGVEIESSSSIRTEKDLVASNFHQNHEDDNGRRKCFLRLPSRE